MDGKITIAVDPDIDKSGVAVYRPGIGVAVYAMTFPELLDLIRTGSQTKKVIIEGGWLNKKTNFHYGKNELVNQKIAHSVGLNHAVGKLLVQCAEHYNIEFKVIKPLQKIWRNGKISHDEINRLLSAMGFNTFAKTNQDERDSLIILLTNI